MSSGPSDREGEERGTYPTKHALVGHNSDGEEVDRLRVVLSAHHLGCHVPGCARRVLRVVLPPDARDAEIRDAQVA